MRAVGAAREQRARALAVEVVADVDDEIGVHRRDRTRDLRERPLVRIVARLRQQLADAATRIAKHHDRARIVRGRGKVAVADAHPLRRGRNGRFADQVAERRRPRRALGHRERPPVGARTRARGAAHHGARVGRAVGAVLEPGREDGGEEHASSGVRRSKADTRPELENPTTDGTFWSQQAYRVRFERGERGAVALADRRAPAVGVMVIVDVLSFSTAVDVATARGASVLPSRYRALTESAQLAKLYDALLAVPRAQRSEESPYTLSPATLDTLAPGARLVLPSPNGARCVRAASDRQIPTIVAGCLRNASAVAAFAVARAGKTAIAVVAAGERWADGTLRPAMEDDLAAGAILAALGREDVASPEAQFAARTFRAGRAALADDIRGCASGRELIEAGYADDVERALQLDVSTNVPVLGADAFFASAS